MKKKPQAVGETAAPYNAKPPAKGKAARKEETSGQGKMSDEAFKKVADKIFSERKELLHKLAQ